MTTDIKIKINELCLRAEREDSIVIKAMAWWAVHHATEKISNYTGESNASVVGEMAAIITMVAKDQYTDVLVKIVTQGGEARYLALERALKALKEYEISPIQPVGQWPDFGWE